MTDEQVPVSSWRSWMLALAVVVSIAVVSLMYAGRGEPGYRTLALEDLPVAEGGTEPPTAMPPLSGTWIEIDTWTNRLRIVRDGRVQLDAACSTGSGKVLRDPETKRVWIFDTPLGVHKVRAKRRDPVWIKPDWAFIEEGKRPPPARSEQRVDELSLGDYSLDLGDGYLIHGTLFQSLVGQGVTHGCIRLGDDDLAAVYREVPIGTTVVIF